MPGRMRVRNPSGVSVAIGAASLLMAALLSITAGAQQPPGAAPSAAANHVAVIEQYCLSCHDADHNKGDLTLESIARHPVSQHPEVWEKVVRKLRARQMPPVGEDRPDEATYDAMAAALEASLDRAAAASPKPGRTATLRRLTRTEYGNAIRDLLAVEVDLTDVLPADESSYGFDNVTVGDLPPMLLERYVSAAQRISRLALGRTGRSPGGDTIRIPADLTQEEQLEGCRPGHRPALQVAPPIRCPGAPHPSLPGVRGGR